MADKASEGRPEQTAGVTYDAFVSYSRSDVAFAEALERRLEHYRPPRGIGLPVRRMKIFRDQQDLVGADYFASIEGFLGDARKLIVLCSPESARSEYVADEIRRYLSTGGPENIIPVLVSGLPNNEAEAEPDEAAFSEALMKAVEMPLGIDYRGIDLRKEKLDRGRFRDAWYTLLARIYDLGREEIEQRDRARTARRRRLWAGAAAALIVVLSGLTIFAFQQKGAAERNALRTQANYLAAESRIALDRDARLSFLLAKHAWQIDPTPTARRNLLAAFYRNSYGDGENVFGSPFYQRIDEMPPLSEPVVLARECPNPTWIIDELPTGSTEAVPFGSGQVALSFDGLIMDGNVRTGFELANPGEPGFEEDDGRYWCIGTMIVSPQRDAAVLIYPYPRPTALLWRPLGDGYYQQQWWEGFGQYLDGPTPVQSAVFSSDGHRLALLRRSGTIEIWETWSDLEPRLLTRLAHEGHSDPIRFSEDGRFVYAATADGQLRWDLETVRIPEVKVFSAFTEPRMTDDGRYLILTGSDRVAAVDAMGVEVTDSRAEEEWAHAAEAVVEGQFELEVQREWYLKGLADESFVVRDGTGAPLFELTVSDVEAVNTGPVAKGAVAANGSRLFVATGDLSRNHLYPLDPDELIAAVDEAGVRLTEEERARFGIR